MIATAAAPTSGVSCDRAPAASAIGVLDALLEIGNPWKNPVAAFAMPRATSSRSASTSSLRFVASDCDSTLVSAIATSAIAKARHDQLRHLVDRHRGHGEPGQPPRQHPDRVDGEVEQRDRRDAADHDDQRGGHPRCQPVEQRPT